MIDGDHDEPTLREQYARERQELERDIAEREDRMKRDEMIEWCRARGAAQSQPEPRVDFPGPLDARPSTRTAAPAAQAAAMSRDWQDYIERQLKRRDRAMTKAIAQVVVAEEKARVGEITALRTTLAEVTERLERLEAMPAARSSPFKAVG